MERTGFKAKTTVVTILTIIGVIFLSANLRAAITSVGPVIKEISDYLGLSNIQAGLVTTIPLLSFGLLSGFVPGVSRKLGMEKVLFFSLVLLTIGLCVRISGNIYLLFAGAALVGAAITAGNVIMPAYIKKEFPKQVGLMTGIYSMVMNLTAALAAGFSIAIGQLTGWGWKGSIGIWAILAFIAVLVWLPQALKKKQEDSILATVSNRSLFKSGLAWNITIFMGLQSLMFYSIVAWLPAVLLSWGMTKEDAGWTLSYVQMAQLPVTFIGSVVASKMKNQQLLVWITGIIMMIGILLLILFKTQFIILSVILIGIAGGLAFSLAMMFFILRTKNAETAAGLSGMAQSFGYMLAATGPPIFGMLHDFTDDWTISFYFLLAGVMALIYVGINASKNNVIA